MQLEESLDNWNIKRGDLPSPPNRLSFQVSFVQYSDEVKSEFKLNTYNDKALALGALQNIRYRGGNTRTGTVHQRVHRPLLSKAFGVIGGV